MELREKLLSSVFSTPGSQNKSRADSSSKSKKKNGKDKIAECVDTSKLSMDPLKMKEVLEVIFSRCDFITLLASRLVCRLWHAEATPILLKRSFITIRPFYYDLFGEASTKKMLSQIFLVPQENKGKTTSKGSKVSKRREQMKIPNIQILTHQDMELFKAVGLLGPNVKKLVYASVCVCPRQLENLIKKNLPNLEWIDLRSSYMEHEDQEELPIQFCRNFLSIACSLAPRVITLAELNLYWTIADPECLQKFQHFAENSSNVRLEKLGFGYNDYADIPGLDGQMAEVLSKVLEKNRGCLQKLRLWSSDVYLQRTQFPCMTKLHFMYMSVYPPRSPDGRVVPGVYQFPPGFQFATHLPKLRELDLFYTNMDNDDEIFMKGMRAIPDNLWDSYFAQLAPCSSVERLTYSDHGRGLKMDSVLKCFSSLKEFFLLRPLDLSVGASSVWKYGQSLDSFNFDVALDEIKLKVSGYDAVFTGFSQETVDRLKNSSPSQISEMRQDIERLRVYPSILDVPGLKILRIQLHGDANKYLPKRIFTVAGVFAFKLRPDLTVEIDTKGCQPTSRALDALKGLRDIPNVKIL